RLSAPPGDPAEVPVAAARVPEARPEPGPAPVLQRRDLRGLRDALEPVMLRRGPPAPGRRDQPAADPLDQPPDLPAGGRGPEAGPALAPAAPGGHAWEAARGAELAAHFVERADAAAGAEPPPMGGPPRD